jgi:hypothetical protein
LNAQTDKASATTEKINANHSIVIASFLQIGIEPAHFGKTGPVDKSDMKNRLDLFIFYHKI